MAESISPRFNPQKAILLSFAGAILVLTGLLLLPGSSPHGLSWIDALFNATSAVCVTGLSTINIETDLTRPGQIILLAGIQAGGLGIITFSVFFSLLFRGRCTFASRLSVGMSPHRAELGDLLQVLGFVLLMTLSFEALGSFILFQRLKEIHPFGDAVFSSVFHSVSAFCNAGYSIYGDNLIRFQHELLVPGCISGLIIFGGLGFMVIDEIRVWLFSLGREKKFRLTVYTRVCLLGSFLLLLAGTVLFYFLERDHLFAGMNLSAQLMNSFFLSVTSRTAGYNTVDTGALMNATLFSVMLLMFVGGCPGSTAGGIKVTTLAVLIALVKDQARFRQTTTLFKRKIPNTTVAKALAVSAASFVVVTVMTLFLQISEKAGSSAAAEREDFLGLFFETVSAFGTVGLSTGVTPTLSVAGKLAIIFLMYIGRVGPLTLALAIVMKRKAGPKYEYVEEDVLVG